jgi:hypothetical protein
LILLRKKSPFAVLAKQTVVAVILAAVAPGIAPVSRAEETSGTDITVMEKLIVETTKIDEHPGIVGLLRPRPTWLYLEFSNYEVLSRCDTEQTVAASSHLAYCLSLDRDIVPEGHIARLATPMSFLMFDHQPSKAMEALIPNAITIADVTTFGINHNDIGLTAGGIDICDADTHCAVQNRWGMPWAFAGASLGHGPIPTGIWFEISHCAPALPRWYPFGFIGPCGLLRMVPGNNSMILAEANWISEANTKAILKEASREKKLPDLPPIEELFRRESESGLGVAASDWPPPAWMAEAALFLRWGLYADHHHRKAFDEFVERSRREIVTEGLFRECFGFGYSEMQVRLSRYLAGPARYGISVAYPKMPHWQPGNDIDHPNFPDLRCREATPSEIARIIGDWERMEAEHDRVTNPALSRLFLRQAGKTLQHCYDDGERDPRFMAVLGLYDVDIGAVPEAHNILAAATKARVARPAAYVALAQLNFDDALEHPAVARARFSAQQVSEVLKPLFAVRKDTALQAAGYRLIAESWSHSDEKPSLLNLAVLQEGASLYPFDADLALASAKAYAQWGYSARAFARP